MTILKEMKRNRKNVKIIALFVLSIFNQMKRGSLHESE